MEAADQAKGTEAREKAKSRQNELASEGVLGPFFPTLNGGEEKAGKQVAFGHAAAQCIRCHKVGSSGGVLGPDLSKVASRLSPSKLLESLVDPQAQLTEGYGLLVATLKDGSTVTGSITQATSENYQLQTSNGKESTLDRSLIASQILTSPMPPAATILSKREIRDLIAFLSTLR